ncbi:prepilin-type N-terminal cleavage/methylation domain-containing protein [Bacillus sp. FJAT-49736]|nr:prepilin-type N-terminal cleavage/methylation domain-containing protein [Bacillus sp. FJAT-49736]MBS4173715.1 prepilin-type N-terminal cleavage/methylation domain-containing protein [Bacillus sp. FJAT-49736]
MEQLKAKIFDNRGITLIELLVTVAISAIFIPVIYGTFITGYKVYEKISIESQLRDDADYISSMIMNSLYSMPFNEITSCDGSKDDNCFEIKNTVETQLKGAGDKGFIDVERGKKSTEINQLKIQLVPFEKDGITLQGIKIGDQLLTTQSNFNGSKFIIHCGDESSNGVCTEGGTIELQLQVSNNRNSKNLHLNSDFGFYARKGN